MKLVRGRAGRQTQVAQVPKPCSPPFPGGQPRGAGSTALFGPEPHASSHLHPAFQAHGTLGPEMYLMQVGL